MLQRLSGHGAAPRRTRRHARRPRSLRRRRRRNPQHFRHQPLSRAAREGTGRSSPHRGGVAVRFRLDREHDRAQHALPDAAGLPGDLRRQEPQFDDRRNRPLEGREEDLQAQRRRRPGPFARQLRSGAPQADRLRVGLFHGREHLADRRDLRCRRQVPCDDFPRRGPCGRHVRPARRRGRRTGRPDAPHQRDPGDAGQGVRRGRRLHRRFRGDVRFRPLVRNRLHLLVVDAAGGRRGRARQRAPPQGPQRDPRTSPGTGGDPQTAADRSRHPGDALGGPYRAGAGRRSDRLQAGERRLDGETRCLCAADQFPDGRAGNRTASVHPDAAAHGRGHGSPDRGDEGRLAPAGPEGGSMTAAGM